MNKTFLCAALALGCFLTGAAQHGFDDVAVAIASTNAAVAAERSRADARIAEEKALNSLGGPEIEAEYKFSPEGSADNRWSLSVGQSFEWPGVYIARRKAAGERINAFEELYLQTLLDKTLEVKLAMIRAAEAKSLLTIRRLERENCKALADAYRRALDAGDATILEVKKTELQNFNVIVECDRAEADYLDAMAALRAFGNAELIPEGLLDSVPMCPLTSLEAYRTAYAASDPGSRSLRHLEAASLRDVSVARRSALPSFTLAYVHDYEDRTHFNGFGVSLSLPSWEPGRKVRAARAAAQAAALDCVDYSVRVNAALDADYEAAGKLFATIAESKATFAGFDYPALLRKALDKGAINLFEYLVEYNEYVRSVTAYIGLRADYARVEARLARFILPIK